MLRTHVRDDIAQTCALFRGPHVALEATLVAIALLTLAWFRGLAGLDLWDLFRTSIGLSWRVRLAGTSPASLHVIALWVGSAVVIGVWLWRRRMDPIRPVLLVAWALTLGAIAVEILGATTSIHHGRNGPWYWSLFTAAPQLLWPVLWSRLGRDVRRDVPSLFLAAPVALIAVLGLWSGLPHGVADQLFSDVKRFGTGTTELVYLVEILFAVLWAALTPLVWWGLRRAKSPWLLGAIALGTAATLGYLGWDDPTVTPLRSLDELAPPPPRAAESTAFLRRMPRGHPEAHSWLNSGWKRNPRDHATWRLFVVAHREAILTDWAASKAQTEWLEKLDTFAAIGDDTHYHQSSQLIRWDAMRDLMELHLAFATQLAIDGRGDEALDVLQRLISVGRKLQDSARTMLPVMAGRILQGYAQPTAEGILDYATCHPEALSKFAAKLRRGSRAGATDALIWQAELQVWALPTLHRKIEDVSLSDPLGPLQRLFLLPRATDNLTIARYSRMAGVVGEGRGEERRVFERDLYRTSFKNPLGTLLSAVSVPGTYDRDLQWSWRVEDDRRALLAKVEAKIAAAASAPPSPPAKTAP